MTNKSSIPNQIKHKLQWYILCVFFLSTNLHAQQVFNESSVNCGGFFDPNTASLQTIQSQLATCTSNSAAYNSKYKLQSFYVPNANDPVITVKITFHVFNKSDGSGSWPSTSSGIYNLQQIASRMHNAYDRYSAQRTDDGYAPTFNPTYIYDSKVNYELTNIYFYNDDVLNVANNQNNPTLFNHIDSIDPSRLKEGLPIIFNNGIYNNNPTSGIAGYATAFGGAPAVHSFIVSPPMGLWWCHEHLIHEIGHVMGWGHTYNIVSCSGDEVCNYGHPCSNYDFLSDVFPTNMGCSTSLGCGACWENGGIYHSNNVMNGGGGNVWMSPLQMGRRIKNLHLPSTGPSNGIRKFAKEMTSSAAGAWQIASNETWDFDIQMYQDIIVKSGATLTLKCKIGMANEGRIIVERGAKLVIDGGEIYAWGSNWAGIQVWGTSNQRQTIVNGMSPNHGIVQIVNQGTVKDAWNAITTIKYDENGNWDWGGYTGGIIQCDGAKFINNRRAIQYLSYRNFNPSNGNTIDNLGYMRRTTFETNAALKNGSEPEVFISMWEVQGIKLYGNIYRNVRTPLPAIDLRGNAINSIDASYYIDRYKICSVINNTTGQCAGYSVNVPSTFSNLYYGVHVQNSTPLTNIKVNDNDFVSCNRAVYFSGTYNTQVTNNRINVGEGQNSLELLPYGIYSENSSAYDISNNTINTTQTTNYNLSLGTGICINGTNGTTNILYKNTINMMGAGTTVFGDNQGLFAGDGLRLRCNQYGQGINGKNYIDMHMAFFYQSNGKIDRYQGSSALGANNFFSHTGNANTQINTDWNDSPFTGAGSVGSINYYYNTQPTQLTKPIYYDNSMTPYSISQQYSTNMCPQSLTTTGGVKNVSTAKTVITTNTQEISNLVERIDGNQTQTLLNAINSNISPGNLKNLLEQKSPYLSDEVLIAYFSKNSIPNGHIKDIHDKNKPVNASVWEVLVNKNLPNGIMKDIKEQQFASGKISEMSKLLGKVADLKQEKAIVVDFTIRELLSDSVNGWNKDSILDLMKFDNRQDATCRLLAAYVALDKFPEATLLANEMKQQEGGALDDFCKLQELLITLKQETKNIYEIKTDAVKKEMVDLIEANKGEPSYSNAQAILSKVYNFKYNEFIAIPNVNSVASGSRLFNVNQEADRLEEVVKIFKLFPNPSSGNTNISFISNERVNSAEIYVYDITGKLVISQSIDLKSSSNVILTEALNSGLYLVNLVLDGRVVEKQKLIKE
jgi:hypothetical protein